LEAEFDSEGKINAGKPGRRVKSEYDLDYGYGEAYDYKYIY
jgi:hypothetical protein